MALYLETSSFLKLAVAEDDSPAIRRWFTGHRPCWSSQLLATEAHRAAAGELGPDLEGVDTYDQRVIVGAQVAGFPVIRP